MEKTVGKTQTVRPNGAIYPLTAIAIALLTIAWNLNPSDFPTQIYGSKHQQSLLEACQSHSYTTEIMSIEPIMLYINNFLTAGETEYLRNLGNKQYIERLYINSLLEDGQSPLSGSLPKIDPIVACVGARAMNFLGFLDHNDYETPWIVNYSETQQLEFHVDPPLEPMEDGNGDRYSLFTSFFIYLDGNCTGGETYFPLVRPPAAGADPNKFIAASAGGYGKGLAVKPRRGSALFWVNMHTNGSIRADVVHAGLPIVSGTKVGMNIWAKHYNQVK